MYLLKVAVASLRDIPGFGWDQYTDGFGLFTDFSDKRKSTEHHQPFCALKS